MNVTIFGELTTDDYLAELTAESETYIGIDANLKIAKQRKYIKEKASTIKGIIKAIGAAKIKKTKDYRCLVESEAARIISILEKANEPFTLLIDDFAAERKAILDKEKAEKLAIELAVQKDIDHEFAILLDKSYLAEKMAAERLQIERDEAIRIDATNRATQAAKNAQEVTDRAIAQDAANRLADSNNVRLVQRAIFSGFINAGLDKDSATKATQAVIDNYIPHVTINY